MYVCLCNAISDKSIREAVRRYQPVTFKELQRVVPVGTQCGKCIHSARKVMNEEQRAMLIFLESA